MSLGAGMRDLEVPDHVSDVMKPDLDVLPRPVFTEREAGKATVVPEHPVSVFLLLQHVPWSTVLKHSDDFAHPCLPKARHQAAVRNSSVGFVASLASAVRLPIKWSIDFTSTVGFQSSAETFGKLL